MLKGKRKQSDYKLLRRKLFFGTTVIVGVSAVLVFLVYSFILRGRFANFVVDFLTNHVYRDRDAALAFYWHVFRDNMDFLLLLAAVGVFLLILRFYMRSFTKYFNQINQGIDAIIQESNHDVVLAPELAATERKINQIKHILAQRSMAGQIAEQRKNDLVMYLAHDLKTPLASSISYLNLLLDQKEIPQALREKYLSIALGKAERLEELINEFLDCAKFNLSHVTLQYSQVDLTRLLEQLVYEFQPFFAEKDLGCQLTLPETATLRCDGEKMQRVFDNLLRNAVLYSDDGSEIGITLQQQEDSVTIRFQNHGPTIPQEKLERIFEQFYRLDTGRSTSGTGLGLAIARQIVTLHRGSLTAESGEALTTFTVTLPLL